MGTRPGLRSIPHISGILLLMQLLLLQPLVDAKAETSAAVDTRSAPASPARVTDFKQETEAHEYRVSITFEGNPHHRGIEDLVKVSTNGWNKTFSEPRDNTAKLKRTFKFVIPEEFKFHQFAIVFGKEVHIFQLKATGFDKHAVSRKYVGLVNYLSEKVKHMMPDYGVGWMSQVVRKELDNIIYTQTNLGDDLRQLKTDVKGIKTKLPDSFDDFVTIHALNEMEGELTVLIKQSETELGNRIDTNENSIAGIESKIPTLQSGAKAAAAEGKKLKEDIQKLKEQLEDVAGKEHLENLKGELKALQTEVNKLTNLKTTVDQRYNELNSKTEENRGLINAAGEAEKKKFEKVEADLTKIGEEMESVEAKFDENLKKMRQKVGEAEKKQTELKGLINTASADSKTKMQSLTTELASFKKSLEKSVGDLTKSIEQKRTEFTEATNELKTKLQTVEKTQVAQGKEIKGNTQLIAAEMAARKKALQQRENKVDEKLKNQKESFKSELAQLNVRVDAVEADSSSKAVTDLLLKHEALKGNFENRNTQVDKSIETVKTEVQSFKNKLDQKAKQLTGKVDAVEDKITKGEEKLGKNIGDLRKDFDEEVKRIDQELEAVKTESQGLKKEIEGKATEDIGNLEKKITNLQADLARLKVVQTAGFEDVKKTQIHYGFRLVTVESELAEFKVDDSKIMDKVIPDAIKVYEAKKAQAD